MSWAPAIAPPHAVEPPPAGDSLLGHWLAMVSRHRQLRLERAARRLRITVTEWLALRQLQRSGRVTQCRLAEAAGLTPPSLSRALASLEEMGCVTRSADPHDLRSIRVDITDAGRALVARLLETEREVDRELFACLGPARCEELAGALRAVVAGDRRA
ncbi:MarR family winged helix-turn-helix transcriptional regulator [Vulcaniibacterium tengchongense]|uniref:DNA-binding MarR family transcriptional regulator n=1 Tax=Vulcaniibacterium tengchongense TaxID=1273429 RepID=A0A3N4VDR6_9GAMM|nr:MarR family transcriptional regulator [Vulcaniibacterium tengchongense]RPE79635.1 DNA-binding MarR family transcriptional regulator [Vulcaniibacterium tengchongense]